MPTEPNWSWRGRRDDLPGSKDHNSTQEGSDQYHDSDMQSSGPRSVPHKRQFFQNDSFSFCADLDRGDSHSNPRIDPRNRSQMMRRNPLNQQNPTKIYLPGNHINSRHSGRKNRTTHDQSHSHSSVSSNNHSEYPDSRVGNFNANESMLKLSKSRHNHESKNLRYNAFRDPYTTRHKFPKDSSSFKEHGRSPHRCCIPGELQSDEGSSHFNSKETRHASQLSESNYSRESASSSKVDSFNLKYIRSNLHRGGSCASKWRDSKGNTSRSSEFRYYLYSEEAYNSESRYIFRENPRNSNGWRPKIQDDELHYREYLNDNACDQFNNGNQSDIQRNKSKFTSGSSRSLRLNSHTGRLNCSKSRLNSRKNQLDLVKSNLNPTAEAFQPKESRSETLIQSYPPNNPGKEKSFPQKFQTKKALICDNQDDISRRSRLTEQLNRGTLECLVCTDYVLQADRVWNCIACYNTFHLKCIIKWSDSSKSDAGWRCPACQNVTAKIPQDYMCFCGKAKLSSGWNRVDNAHSCGEICGRTQKVEPFYKPCIHSCTLLCHAGPCPACIVMVSRECGCGRTSQSVQCNSKLVITCDSLCSKPLNCLKHFCQQPCHFGECLPCNEKFEEACHCGKEIKTVICGTVPLNDARFNCGKLCNRMLRCETHKCKKVCHEGECELCKFLPDKAKTCWCGKTSLTLDQLCSRQSCADPLPTCDAICGKIFSCGPPLKHHSCQEKCHENSCPMCVLKTSVKCCCGSMSKEINCSQLKTKAAKFQCTKRCTKKRTCGRHKCNKNCCIDTEHICPSICNRRLTCGLHVCEMLCHPGNCLPCSNISFEELSCHCGQTVSLPPIPCGARPPKCNGPCLREHECKHEQTHNCHSGTTCPPCPALTTRKCFGGHETRNTIPCHIKEFSCGLPCNKPLPCKTHKCIQPCHKDPCSKKGKSCSQPCPKPRALCRHLCGKACHSGPCPVRPCKELVKVSCQCGHRTSSVACFENNAEYEKIISAEAVRKSSNLHFGGVAMELSNLTYGVDAKTLTIKKLECNGECELLERNRKLALGLQIRNPDLSAKLVPRYSDFMMQWAKRDILFCQCVHEKLVDLVHLAKQSKQKSRSFSFEVMNRAKRQFVHEYCEHFGVESVSYDAEPKRNVVATASRDTSWLPSYSLMEVIQRQNGERKIHVPVQNSTKSNSTATRKNEMPVMQPSAPVDQPSCWTLLTKPQPTECASTSRKFKKPDYFSDNF
nr:PREDICTED: protein shuttle craft [Bemisia tabaci]